MHDIQRQIIDSLKYKPLSTFSELGIIVESNKLSYHLRELEKQDLISQNDLKYSLTDNGKKLLNFLDKESQLRKQPVSVVALLPVDGDKVLLQKRKKEPWLDYWMLIAGKIEFGEKFSDAVARELMEEAGLCGDASFMGMVSSQSFESDQLQYHVHMYCYKVSNLSGDLISEIKEGKNTWFALSEISSLNWHPLDKMIFEKMHEEQWLLEHEEYFESGKLLRSEIRAIE